MAKSKTRSRKPPKGCCTIFVRTLPTALKHQFRAWCARRGMTMRDKIIDLMRETVKEEVTHFEEPT